MKDGKLYTGFTPDLRSRIKAHENGFVRETKDRRPLQLIHYEAFLKKKMPEIERFISREEMGKKELEVKLREYFRKKVWKK